MRNRSHYFDLKEMIWDHIHMLLDLPAARNLACNFFATSDMVLSSKKSMEPSPRRKE